MVVLLRVPVVAGSFYEFEPHLLRNQLEHYFQNAVVKKRKIDIKAAIVPHATYFYSGQIAASPYANMEKSNFVVLGSNHTLTGSDFALMKSTLWKTPIGEAVIDDGFANKVLHECDLIHLDAIPHSNEYSIEVQLPFMIHKFSEFKFLPIMVNNLIQEKEFFENYKVVGKALGKVMKKNKNWKLIGSSDMSQNSKKSATVALDKKLIKHILKMDVDGFMKEIVKNNALLCGYGVIATTMAAAKEMGARKGEVLSYSSTPEAERDVVGYASIIFY